jgi:HAD superfamily hydrolase (TIGR01509 family)
MLGREASPEELQTLGDWKEERYRQIVSQGLTAPEGLTSLLNDLKAHHFRIAVGSSGPKENVDLVLDKLEIRGFFNAVVYGGMVSRGKPAPDTFLAAGRMLDVPPARCVVVEDAVPGVQAGKAAGMSVVAITTTRAREDLSLADLTIDRFTEVTAADFVHLL